MILVVLYIGSACRSCEGLSRELFTFMEVWRREYTEKRYLLVVDLESGCLRRSIRTA